jgi:hypothetical protein
MAAHAHLRVPRSHGLKARLRAFTGRLQLDRELTAGASEAGSPEQGAAVPVRRDEVLAAQRDLLRLVAALRSAPAPPVRSIAAVSLLLTDGTGPLFAPYPRGSLREVAFQAAFCAEAG